ncbi:universal stress protein [Arthrobacter sp. B2a2-09]|uniref:universal stress protein n=1 Tax=Arthrobacter sp. B2a2-09 TaxID=2952822 RepID=UPI0022CDB3C1|nr:universal stress protein [Arthrobacter sp. B2a2-09]MCZ9881173.1 universal stress protein [Arthrobacter sp. B2a2-09]
MSNPRGEDTPLAKGSSARLTGPVLAGVLPHQPGTVVEKAAEVALSAGLELVLAFADVTSFPAAGDRNGHLVAQPIDPDGIDDDAAAIAESLQSRIADQLDGTGVRWTFVTLAGEPARSLGRYAASINASMIVVGTKEHGLGPKFEGLVTGSVALHLAHRQNCPVLMVPLGRHDASRDQ